MTDTATRPRVMAVCSRCGARASGDTYDEVNAAIPGHPFTLAKCPTPPPGPRKLAPHHGHVPRPTTPGVPVSTRSHVETGTTPPRPYGQRPALQWSEKRPDETYGQWRRRLAEDRVG